MRSNEEKEIRAQLRVVRTRRKEINTQIATLKAERVALADEHAKLVNKAEKIGISIGKRANSKSKLDAA